MGSILSDGWLVYDKHDNLDNPKPFDYHPTAEEIESLPNQGRYCSEQEQEQAERIWFNKSIDELSQYANYAARGSYNEPWMIDLIYKLLSRHDIVKGVCDDFNIIAYGSMAWIAIYCQDNILRDKLYRFIEDCRIHRKTRRNTM